ncbi:MAG: TetR/AcrR family transcriptional regulator [Paracoccaceae bacterium]
MDHELLRIIPVSLHLGASEQRVSVMPKYHHGNLRNALLESAEIEIEQKGIEALSLRQVAKRAGVSHAAPAKHFKKANDLLTALAAKSFQNHLGTIECALEDSTLTNAAKLVVGGMAYVSYAIDHPNMFDLQFNSKRPDRNDPELAKAGSAAFGIVVQLMGAALGEKGKSEVFVAATSLWVFLHGLACLAANDILKRLDLPFDGSPERPEPNSSNFMEQMIKDQVRKTLK